MTLEQQNSLKEIFRRNIFSLAELAANCADEVLVVLSSTAQTQQVTFETQSRLIIQREQKRILTKKEIALFLSISERLVSDLINEGLPVIRNGRTVRFDREEVLEWAKNRNIKRRRKNNLRVVK